MKYCKRCVMPDTRPGIVFNEEGVCQPCLNYEKRKSIDWDSRFEELRILCDAHKKKAGDNVYDCLIAVSGGKDSHYQVHVMKELMGMNPLLVTVEDNFPMTDAGRHNLQNISEAFGCHLISLKPNIRAQKKVTQITFEKYGGPNWYIDRLIYTYPLHMAKKFDIPLVVYGENVSYEYGGLNDEETPSAKDQIYNGVASEIPFDELLCEEVTENDLAFLKAPNVEDMDAISLEPVYLSYFVPWNSYANFIFAKKRGFHDLSKEWKRSHHIQDFDQVDSRGYLVHAWFKYPKFGHASATDYASRFIRYGLLTRDEAVELVKKHDFNLDPLAVSDFIEFAGYSEKEFWEIVDSFYNQNIFRKNEFGEWFLKEPVWNNSQDDVKKKDTY